ncbi:hypothetical protein H2248_011191 [Termitomyces sp. 'cryptogamus']|nr:hypothetical protein H2248_011191 [Termitomyces sp. 'cryptogamus']
MKRLLHGGNAQGCPGLSRRPHDGWRCSHFAQYWCIATGSPPPDDSPTSKSVCPPRPLIFEPDSFLIRIPIKFCVPFTQSDPGRQRRQFNTNNAAPASHAKTVDDDPFSTHNPAFSSHANTVDDDLVSIHIPAFSRRRLSRTLRHRDSAARVRRISQHPTLTSFQKHNLDTWKRDATEYYISFPMYMTE